MATCDGNEEDLASFAVRDSNTAQLAADHFGNAAVSEIRFPLGSHFRSICQSSLTALAATQSISAEPIEIRPHNCRLS